MRFTRVVISFLALGAAALVAGCASSATEVVATTQEVAPAQANGPQWRVALSALDYKGTQRGDIGQGLADLLGAALAGSGRFVVADAAPGGQPAQLLLSGSVSAFEPACSAGSEIIVSGNQACVSLNLTVTDAASGRVVSAVTVDGSSDGNAGTAAVAYARGELPPGLVSYRGMPMELAIRKCLDQAVSTIAASKALN